MNDILMKNNTHDSAEYPEYLSLIRNHYNRILCNGTDIYGEQQTGMWLASIDIENGGLPKALYPAKRRVYREISAPRGSSLYWEQPAVAVAYSLSHITHDRRYAKAADDYLIDFLKRCISPENGLFLWGNHLYYDVFRDSVVHFSGSVHEARPLPCAWEMFWRISPRVTERAIRSMGRQHIKNQSTGLFDRHASITETALPETTGETNITVHSFLEAGGVLIESLCWLAGKTGDKTLGELALKCARYSFQHRDAMTGLVRNQAHFRRWDYYASTTEVGLWAGCLLQAAEYSDIDELRDIARQSVSAWLRYGYDESASCYLGSLNLIDGAPSADAETEYAPGLYADLWEPLFPTHNYPMPMAETCISLFQQTGDEQFRIAIERWSVMVARNTPANNGEGAYADQYGRCIHFLTRAADVLKAPDLKKQAINLASEAIAQLYSPQAKMFRSHPGEERCDAVDGIGILFFAMLYLQTGDDPNALGFHF